MGLQPGRRPAVGSALRWLALQPAVRTLPRRSLRRDDQRDATADLRLQQPVYAAVAVRIELTCAA